MFHCKIFVMAVPISMQLLLLLSFLLAHGSKNAKNLYHARTLQDSLGIQELPRHLGVLGSSSPCSETCPYAAHHSECARRRHGEEQNGVSGLIMWQHEHQHDPSPLAMLVHSQGPSSAVRAVCSTPNLEGSTMHESETMLSGV